MRQNLYRNAGYYETCYLRMNVDSNAEFLNFDKSLSEIDIALFFHEYIHYLQDITTTYGFMNLASEVDLIKQINLKIRTSEEEDFKVPYKTDETDGNVYWNELYNKIVIGGGEHLNNLTDINIGTEKIKIDFPSNPVEIDRVILNCKTNNRDVKYYFGSYCISETMAYELEQYVYPNVLPAPPTFPYKTGRVIADLLYPNFSNDPLNIIALCDASLMYSDPSKIYHDMLKMMVDDNFAPKSPDDIYKYVFDRIKFNQQGIADYKELFLHWGLTAHDQINDYFTTNAFHKNSSWITSTISGAIHLRNLLPSFILDIARCGDLRESTIFQATLNKVGSPLILNNENKGFFANKLNRYGVKIDPSYFGVFKEIKGLTTKDWGERTNLCGLKEFCQQSCTENGIEDFTNYDCRTSPWKRVNVPDVELCPFGATWKSWGLAGKNLIETEDE